MAIDLKIHGTADEHEIEQDRGHAVLSRRLIPFPLPELITYENYSLKNNSLSPRPRIKLECFCLLIVSDAKKFRARSIIFFQFLLSQMQAKKISRLMIQPHVGAILMCEQPPMFDTNIHFDCASAA